MTSSTMRASRMLNQSRRSHRSTSSVTTTITTASRSASRTYASLSRSHSASHSCPRSCPLCSSSARSMLPSSSSSRLTVSTSYSASSVLSSYTPPTLPSSSFHSSSHSFETAQPAAATTSTPPNIPASHAALFAQGLLPSPTAITTPTQRVRDLFTELTQLSQFEMAQLHNLLNKSYGVPTSSRTNFGLGQGGGMAGAPQPAAGGPAAGAAVGGAKVGEEKKEEKAAEVKTAFSVRLDGFNAADKIKVIKEVRTATGLGLKESKELVEGAPKTIKKDLNKADCDALVAKLKEAGAKVTVE